MRNKMLAAGDFVEAKCTRCRTETNHTIIAMVAEQPARVRCNTCGGDHNFRAPRKLPVTKTVNRNAVAAAKPVRQTAKTRQNADREKWQGIMDQAESGMAVPYAMDRGFKLDDIVAHQVFGFGVVTGLSKPNKVEILFTDGKKILRCQL
jgi:hypothetical protein